MKNVINKYLANYAEKEFLELNEMIHGEYDHVLIIPAFSEGAQFLENLIGLSQRVTEKVLVIIVINEPPFVGEAVSKSQTLLKALGDVGNVSAYNARAITMHVGSLDIVAMGPIVIERRMGVGLARKIGCDLALKLIEKGRVRYPIIYSTDADATLQTGYFESAREAFTEDQTISAFIYPFKHIAPIDEKQKMAIELYERRLCDYVAGLRFANSPYAFHTIGSTIAINAHSYAKVRGFPKVAAGEDFYLLNKLRKVSQIKELKAPPILLSARRSSRVPFGTGPSISNILRCQDPSDAQIFYHPEIFKHLACLLAHQIRNLSSDKKGILADIETVDKTIDIALVHKGMAKLLEESKLQRSLSTRKNSHDRIKAFHDWFDAFKTLKFIHYLRDARFPMLSARDFQSGNFLVRETLI